MVFQMIHDLLSALWLKMTGFFFWTSETTTTKTGEISLPPLVRNVKKPPLVPKKAKRRRETEAQKLLREIGGLPVVLYLDDDYWDARMTEVDD